MRTCLSDYTNFGYAIWKLSQGKLKDWKQEKQMTLGKKTSQEEIKTPGGGGNEKNEKDLRDITKELLGLDYW